MIILGLMSGTSMDGLDAVFCSFHPRGKGYDYVIHYGTTLPYDEDILDMLRRAPYADGYELIRIDRKYGHYIGKRVNELIRQIEILPDVVASHGHTIFHNPADGLTLQIGHGPAISAECNLPVMYDFRSLDVALGGQGAPLVPIGDQLLFSQYDACLNLGGFANVSIEKGEQRIAWDISPANYISNHLVRSKGLLFDPDGSIGATGATIPELLKSMESLEYYQRPFPKSLGREWCEQYLLPLIESSGYSLEDVLHTYYEHVSTRIVSDITIGKGKVLCTGGGVKNRYLMELIRQKSGWEVVIPNNEIVDFKEALIFAFLCFLKQSGQPNCLSSVTGASRDNLSGSLV